MQTSIVRRLGPALLALAAVVAPTGCQSGLFATDARAMAMAALSEEVKTSVKAYLADVDSVVALLTDVKDVPSALSTAPKLTPYVEKVQSAYGWFQSLDPATLDHVRTAFEPELKRTADGFSGQLDRIAGSSGWGSVLKPVVSQVKLFS